MEYLLRPGPAILEHKGLSVTEYVEMEGLDTVQGIRTLLRPNHNFTSSSEGIQYTLWPF